MKKFFEVVGLLTLVCFSFFYTEKTVNVVKEVDEVMIAIKDKAAAYSIPSKEAVITDLSIVPGYSGKVVNVASSYQKMKSLGSFNENFLVFDDVLPKELLKKHINKYVVGGNPNKKQVSLIFLVKEHSKLDKILKILDQNNVKGNFFVDGNWFEKNNDDILKLIESGHNVGNLSYNLDYQNSSFVWMDTIIKKIGKQKVSFCYKTKKVEDLEICTLQKNYTIAPTAEISLQPFSTMKSSLQSGALLSFEINSALEQELPLIISYIRSKGLSISVLIDHLSEK